jgi:hypothetical protein
VATFKDWDQRQREQVLQGRMAQAGFPKGSKVESYYDATGRRKMRFVDPNTGDYYDVTEDYNKGMKTAMEILAEHVAKQEKEREARRLATEEARREYEARKGYAPDPWDAVPVPDVQRSEDGGWYIKRDDFGQLVTENKIKATIHKTAHFPTAWIAEAIDRAETSTKCITFAIEREGIVVTAMEAGERYAVKVSDWAAMETSEVNPLLHAIDEVERKLDILQDLKKAVG